MFNNDPFKGGAGGQRRGTRVRRNLFSNESMLERLGAELAGIEKQLETFNEGNMLQNFVLQIQSNQQALVDCDCQILESKFSASSFLGPQQAPQMLFHVGMPKGENIGSLYCQLIETTFAQKDLLRNALSIKTHLFGFLYNIKSVIQNIESCSINNVISPEFEQDKKSELEQITADMESIDCLLSDYLVTCSEHLVDVAKNSCAIPDYVTCYIKNPDVKAWFSPWHDAFGNSNDLDIQTPLGYDDHVRLLDTALQQFEQPQPQAMHLC